MPPLVRCPATTDTFDGDRQLRCVRTTTDAHADDQHVFGPAKEWLVFGELPDDAAEGGTS